MILDAMLQRLFASLVSGPSMNARPHNSRQRVDLLELTGFHGQAPEETLKLLLEKRKLEFPAKVPVFTPPKYPEAEWSSEQKQARDAFAKQSRLLKKLREIAEDARDYMNDHGESCLALGFPLLSLPQKGEDSGVRGSSRILAPLLLMPIDLQVRTTSRIGITLQCVGEGADLLMANPALIAWLERQTGKPLADSLFHDEEGTDPWKEVRTLLQGVSEILALEPAAALTPETLLRAVPVTEKLPKGTSVISSAVLGLFPLSNQSLLRDTRWMMEHEAELQEPASSFLKPEALHHQEVVEPANDDPVEVPRRDFATEWLVSAADPCQANAVISARNTKALVVHGPPGTGKSQTITNMIADHLARGERVLFVCDKRTALDVVKYRLDAVGLGDFCGVVHDPSGDRKDFYMGLRTKLENLADTPLPHDPKSELQRINQGLASAHQELEGYRQKIHGLSGDGQLSFHELLGSWLALSSRDDLPVIEPVDSLTLSEVEAARTALDEIARRAERANYGANPFRGLLGITLPELMTRSGQDLQMTLEAIHAAAIASDAARPGELILDSSSPFSTQAAQCRTAAATLQALSDMPQRDFLRAALDSPASLAAEFKDAQAWLTQITSQPLDRALVAAARSAGALTLSQVNSHLAALNAWQTIAGSFFKSLFAGSVKKHALAALAPLGLALENSEQGLTFYAGLKSRLLLIDLLARIEGSNDVSLADDADIEAKAVAFQAICSTRDALKAIKREALLPEIITAPQRLKASAEDLTKEALWTEKLDHLVTLVRGSGLFIAGASTSLAQQWAGENTADLATQWLSQRTTVEDMVRLEAGVEQLPESLRRIVPSLAVQGATAEECMALFTRQATENQLKERLRRDPDLASIDGERVEAAFTSYRDLNAQKSVLVRDYVRWFWLKHQRARLLAGTGTQINSHGSALRQRLYVKGKKALKLRQMLATGMEVENGDPIYDLCPVWMASPSTVAQIFPRRAIFDVIIFDEASQCRLEEALPVLLRGHRVVIAGDQKQLPPTRFFESSLADSGDSDAETAEELFYQQQQDAEDLLTASLNLDVREAYLDVHYRSRNEDLIGFSNHAYYGSRLQPIPGHPRNKALNTPIRLHRVEGVYKDRANIKEAEAAVALVAELLGEESPPSIGLACFNLTQREAILEALDELAEKDAEFARRLEVARQRKGRDSFEGLFVKNLENVQGDERDIMIICTTFGPDEKGKFRRNFGVLSQREGGRRLNVLVTRARTAVHVFTSIPASELASREIPPPGTLPNGRLQLYDYLRYADQLALLYADYQNKLEQMRRDTKPETKLHESATPSRLAAAIGQTLLERHQTGSHVHWGNDGFCVDVACIHPLLPADVTIGILTDFSRFHKTPDPIAWDLFRAEVLRGQGWQLQRVWSPVLFRRMSEMMERVTTAHKLLAAERVNPGAQVPT